MTPTRRELVGLLGTGIAASLAGCSGSADSQSPAPGDSASAGEDEDDQSESADGDGTSDSESPEETGDKSNDSTEQTLDADTDWQLVDNPPALENDLSPQELEKSSLTRAFGSVEAYTKALETEDAVDPDAEYLQLLEDKSGVLVYHQGYGRNGCYDLTLESVDREESELAVSFQMKDTSSETAACTMAIVTPAKLLVVPMESVPESVKINGGAVSVET